MKTYNKIIVMMILTWGSVSAIAQQAPMYTHYMYNTLVVNPAYAGCRDALTITGLHRSQWVDFRGAPMTQTLTMHAPIANQHIGIGLSVFNDKIGPTNNTSIFFDFAYIMKITEKAKFALGMSAGINIMQLHLNSLNLDQQNDPVFQFDIRNRVTPNFGFGAYYYRERFYAGISAPNLLQNTYSTTSAEDGSHQIAKEKRHYYLIAGTLINLAPNLAFKPSTLVKITSSSPIQADLTASFVIVKKLLIGVMVRSGDAVGGLVGLDITEQLHLGYSFDWSYGLKTFKYNHGSHEVMLRYDFIFSSSKQIHSPRNF